MNFSKKSGNKKAAAAAVVCFVAAIAIAGTYTFNDYKKSQSEEELAKAEEMELTEEKYTVTEGESLIDETIDQAVDGEIVANEVSDADASGGDNAGDVKTESEEGVISDGEIAGDNLMETSDLDVESISATDAANVNFSDNSEILWPISGILLMDYSMDKTIYFKTLDQYKYNPAIVIAAAENDQVIAGVSGIVKSIDNVAETGTTVNIDFGNGYEAFYGQLLNVTVKTGDYVEATTTLGYIANPTKYYSSEGSNLYFEMRKDGQPVDPKEFLAGE